MKFALCNKLVQTDIKRIEGFFNGLNDSDERVVSPKKCTQSKTRVEKANPIYEQNSNIGTLFMTKTANKSYPLDR